MMYLKIYTNKNLRELLFFVGSYVLYTIHNLFYMNYTTLP